jgi:hypothetical protein
MIRYFVFTVLDFKKFNIWNNSKTGMRDVGGCPGSGKIGKTYYEITD